MVLKQTKKTDLDLPLLLIGTAKKKPLSGL